MGIPLYLIHIIKNLYESSIAKVRFENAKSRESMIKKRVRQGYCHCYIIYTIYTVNILWDECWRTGTAECMRKKEFQPQVCGRYTPNCQKREELLVFLRRLEKISQQYGLRINKSKTKIMIVDREHNNLSGTTHIEAFEVVEEFVYLGALINNKGDCGTKIRRHIQMGKVAMVQLTKVWKSPSITQQAKINLIKTLVFSVFHYASEIWTLRVADRRRMDAFEMWCWRRMLRILWTAKRMNV